MVHYIKIIIKMTAFIVAQRFNKGTTSIPPNTPF